MSAFPAEPATPKGPTSCRAFFVFRLWRSATAVWLGAEAQFFEVIPSFLDMSICIRYSELRVKIRLIWNDWAARRFGRGVSPKPTTHIMKTTTSLFLAGMLGSFAISLRAQDAEPETPPPAVPALESAVNLQITLTATGAEKAAGPAHAKVYSAGFDVTKLNTKAFVERLDAQYDLVDHPKDFSLVAVRVETETENGYRFYLKNKKPKGTPAYVYLSPEILGLTVDATALRYREVQNGEEILSGGGQYKHAISVDSAGFSTQGVAAGAYRLRDVTVDGVTARLTAPAAMTATTTGYYTDHPDTPEARTYIAQARWVFTAGKAVDLNDYPVPPPAPEPLPAE